MAMNSKYYAYVYTYADDMYMSQVVGDFQFFPPISISETSSRERRKKETKAKKKICVVSYSHLARHIFVYLCFIIVVRSWNWGPLSQ